MEVLVGGEQVETISLPSIPRRVRVQVSNMGETVTEGREDERWEGGRVRGREGRREGGREGERGEDRQGGSRGESG